MNAEKFVYVLKKVVEQSAVDVVIDSLTNNDSPNYDNLNENDAKWYANLSVAGRESFHRLLQEVASTSLFGFLCVLDGVRAIDNDPDKGDLELYYVKKQNKILLNDFNEEFLHDIYNSLDSKG